MEQIEETLFARKRWMENKMTAYSFQKIKDGYTLEKPLMGGDFKAVLTVNAKGKIAGKVIDPMTLDEYYQLRQEAADGAYVHTVRSAYAALLRDIADRCCRDVLFASPQANRLTQRILDQFQVRPDFPWEHSARYQSYGTFRHASNRKWFALIMNVKRRVLDKDGTPDLLDVMNLKIPPQEAEQLHRIPGIYPAYHMNHRLWISVVLDDSLADEDILALIKTSYLLTE